MLLVFLTLCGLLYDLSIAYEHVEKCYGDRLRLPPNYAPAFYKGPLYFTPRSGGPQKLMTENGESKDPRLVLDKFRPYLRDLKVEDEGYFSVYFDGATQDKILDLTISECSEESYMHYGGIYTRHIPSDAEVLEFTPLRTSDNLMLVWNRSDPLVNAKSRIIRKDNFYGDYWEIVFVTQKHSGYYNFRRKDNYLVSRIHLQVEVTEDELVGKVGKNLDIQYPWPDNKWTASFRPYSKDDYLTRIENGEVIEDAWFEDRIEVDDGGISINPVESKDEGTFQFRDEKDNLAWVVHLSVENEILHVLKYVGVAGIIILFLVTCCCCYKCKNKRRNRATANPVVPLGVHYHGDSQPPTYTAPVPGPSASTPLPVYSSAPNKPAAASDKLLDAGPQVRPSGPTPPISTGYLASDSEPQYELKGMDFLSAPPLSSESAEYNVYTSEKLNFL